MIAIDDLNDYYSVNLKQARLDNLAAKKNFSFIKIDIAARDTMAQLFKEHKFDLVIHLAAQAGVRYSIEHPARYMDSNLIGFGNILEGCRHTHIKHLLYASSSSVYGGNRKQPFSEDDPVDHPISLYAATKKANELMAHSYSHLYGLRATGIRFFTVYGPWGRPDMAFFKFTQLIMAGKKIPVYNNGDLARDFTYIDDVVEGVMRLVEKPPIADSTTKLSHRVYNLGNGDSTKLMDYIHQLEEALGMKAQYEMMPMQLGDVKSTSADMTRFKKDYDYRPTTTVAAGLTKFVNWYRKYYGV